MSGAVISLNNEGLEEFAQGHGKGKLLGPDLRLSGLNYRGTSLSVRERFGGCEQSAYEIIKSLKERNCLDGAVFISTCNRVELITIAKQKDAKSGDGSEKATADALSNTVFSELSGVSHRSYADALYHARGDGVVRHLFRVASGLDSMVLGEPQILGQVKRAYSLAAEAGTASPYLHRLFHSAFSAAKEVRSKTKIGQHAVSLCYAVRELAERVFGDLSTLRVMLIGTGEMGQLALRHFQAAGTKVIYVVSRSHSRAVALAQCCGGVALEQERLSEFLPQVDLVIGATAIPQGASHIVTSQDVQRMLRQRSTGSLFFADLGVPRNFEGTIADLDDVYLYNIDQLEGVVRANLDKRQIEKGRAEIIVEEKVRRFAEWSGHLAAEPMIRRVFKVSQEQCAKEILSTKRRLARAGFSPSQLEVIGEALHDMSRALVTKSLHVPVSKLREIGAKDPDIFKE